MSGAKLATRYDFGRCSVELVKPATNGRIVIRLSQSDHDKHDEALFTLEGYEAHTMAEAIQEIRT